MNPIGWCDVTINPVIGCTPVSSGCAHCYAARFASRGLTERHRGTARCGKWTGKLRWVPSELEKPLRWRKPRRIFVCSMSDMFHEGVTDEWRDRVFATVMMAHWHEFIVLTKRPTEAREYFLSRTPMDDSLKASRMPQWYQVVTERLDRGAASFPRGVWDRVHDGMQDPSDCIKNLTLGVSVEDQATADERIPLLLRIPAARRIVSYEPALGPADWDRWLLTGDGHDMPHTRKPGIDVLIAGPETGPGARPCDPAWLQSAADQCRAAGVCFWLKKGTLPDGTQPREWPAKENP